MQKETKPFLWERWWLDQISEFGPTQRLIPLRSPERWDTPLALGQTTAGKKCSMVCSHNHMNTPACIPWGVQLEPPAADHTGRGPATLQFSVSLLSTAAKCYHPALCEPKMLHWNLRCKNIVHSCHAWFFFFQHNGAFVSSQALFTWWLWFSRYQIWKIILYSTFCYAASRSSMSFALQ